MRASSLPPDVSRTSCDTEARETEERLANEHDMWASLGVPVYPGVDLAREQASGKGAAGTPFGLGSARPFDPTATDTRPEMAAARTLLGRIAALSNDVAHDVAHRDSKQLGLELRELVAIENEIQRRLGRLLSEMDRRRDWPCLRFTSLGHYAEQRLGMCRRTAERYAGIERALGKLPLVLAA